MGYEGVYLWNAVNGKPEKLYRSNFEKEKKGFNLGKLGAAALGTYAIGSAFGGHIPSGGEAAAVAAGTSVLMTSAKDIQKLMLPALRQRLQLVHNRFSASTSTTIPMHLSNKNQGIGMRW